MGTATVSTAPRPEASAQPLFVLPRRRSTAAALIALLVVQAVLFVTVSHRSFFFAEDFINFKLVQDRFFVRYVFTPILGVYPAPGERLAIYVLYKLFPLNFWAAQIFLVVLLAVATTLLWQLVRTFANRDEWWTVTLLAPFAISLTLVVPMAWWAAGIPILPALIFTEVAIAAWLRAYTNPNPTFWIAVSVVAVTAAGAFDIKFLLIPVYLLFLRLVVFPRLAGVSGGIRSLWQERWRWMALAAPPAAYLAVFVLSGIASRSATEGARPYLEYFAVAWFRAVIPVSFLNARLDGSDASASSWIIIVLSQIVFWGLVAVTWKRSALALRGWALFVLVFGVNVGMVGTVRLPSFGVGIAYTLRYYPEVVLFIPLALALALRYGQERRPESAWEQRPWARVGMAVAACLLVIPFFIWAPRMVEAKPGIRTRIWYENLRSDVEALTAGGSVPRIVDSETPWYVMPDWMAPTNRVSTILSLAHIDVKYNESSSRTYLVRDDGRLAEAEFRQISELVSSSTSAPGVRVLGGSPGGPAVCFGDGGRLEYRPDKDVTGDRLAIRVTYDRAGRLPVAVKVDAHDATRPFRFLELHPSESEVELVDLGTSQLRALTLEASPGDRVCVEQMEIGSLVARTV
jgi:hypothetical protein